MSPIPAICAPTAALIYLIEAGDDIYARDFHLHDAPALRAMTSGIDHLALGMEAESRDNWIIFPHTVFGFTLEHADAAGSVWSGA